MSGPGEGGIARWSRRKRAARKETAGMARERAEERVDAPPAVTEDARDGGEKAASGGVPPIEELDGDSDYRPFLAPDVAPELARAALRKLWRSDPLFAIRDGLDDYDDDFKAAASLVDMVKPEMPAEGDDHGGAHESAKAGGAAQESEAESLGAGEGRGDSDAGEPVETRAERIAGETGAVPEDDFPET